MADSDMESAYLALRTQVARLEGEVAGLRAVVEAFSRLVAPRSPSPPSVHTHIGCIHDFPSHQVGVVACSKCGMISPPIYGTTTAPISAKVTVDGWQIDPYGATVSPGTTITGAHGLGGHPAAGGK